MLFTLSQTSTVHFYSEPTAMSYGFPGLCNLIETKLKKKPDSGDLFLFINKRKTYLKMLYWQEQGWCMFMKKLVGHQFETTGLKKKLTLKDIETLINDLSAGIAEEEATIPHRKAA